MSSPSADRVVTGPSRRKSLIRRLLLTAIASVGLLVLIGTFYEIESEPFKILAKRQLESMYDRRIEVGEASVTFLGRVVLRDVRVYNPPGYSSEFLMRAPRIDLTMGMTGGDTSAFRPRRIVLEGAEFWFERPDNNENGGKWNTQDLWVKKEKTVLPTFRLPIELVGATVHYSDSHVGSRGIAVTFRPIDVDYNIVSDGREITTTLTTANAPLPEGGVMDFDLHVQPARRKAQAKIRLSDAALGQLRPYFEFVRLLEIDGGVADVEHDIDFDGNHMSVTGKARITGAKIVHAPSGVIIPGISPVVEYDAHYGDTSISFDTVAIEWGGSRLSAEGWATKRGVFPQRNRIAFRTVDARAEDISFLLSDRRFSASGPVAGECIFESERETMSAAPSGHYDAFVLLDKADVHYGSIVRKEPGPVGRLNLEGTAGERPSLIAIELGNSRISLTPLPDGWRLKDNGIAAEDLTRYFLPLRPYTALKLAGSVGLDVNTLSEGRVTGVVDLKEADIVHDSFLSKRRGLPASLVLAGAFGEGRITADRSRVMLGGSSATISGSFAPDGIQAEITVPRLRWSDAATNFPALNWNRMALSGDASGNFAIRMDSPASGSGRLVVELTLDATELNFHGAVRKALGDRCMLRTAGDFGDGEFSIDEGELLIRDTLMSLQGTIASSRYDLHLTGKHTGLDGLRAILASHIWRDLDELSITGLGDVSMNLESEQGVATLEASVNAFDASMSLRDFWQKPQGELFQLRANVTKSPTETRIETLELLQGRSRLAFSGDITPEGKLSGTMRADIDVDNFLKSTPGLSRTKTGAHRTSDALVSIRNDAGFAEIHWTVSGTAAKPEIALNLEKMPSGNVAAILSRQLGRITGVFFSPMRFGAKLFGELVDELSESN